MGEILKLEILYYGLSEVNQLTGKKRITKTDIQNRNTFYKFTSLYEILCIRKCSYNPKSNHIKQSKMIYYHSTIKSYLSFQFASSELWLLVKLWPMDFLILDHSNY